MRRNINGILLLDKPPGFTSNGVLQRVKRLFYAKKAGHTGSLDPIATGMLPLCFGEATKFSQFLLDSDKSYRVVAKLGVTTNTGDTEGEVTSTSPVVDITETRIAEVIKLFVGEIEQVPPMFSALKHQGRPLYELARQGIEVERKARKISIFSITLENVYNDEITLNVHCSKGTYIRTLVADIGNVLGCGAHVTALRRTHVSPYNNAAMYTLPTLEAIHESLGFEGLAACLLPAHTAVQALPEILLSTAAAFYVRMGQAVRATLPGEGKVVRLMAEDGGFLGLGEVLPDGRVKPHRLLAMQAESAVASTA